MNDKFVKLNCTFKEKILFLFTGIIDTKHLINNTVYNTKLEDVPIKGKDTVKKESIPDKLDIPFFELDTTEVSDIQSNL